MAGEEVFDRCHREDEGGRKWKQSRRRVGGFCWDFERVQSTAHGESRRVICDAED